LGEEDGAERTDRQEEAMDHDGSSVPATGRNVNRSRSEEFWRGTAQLNPPALGQLPQSQRCMASITGQAVG